VPIPPDQAHIDSARGHVEQAAIDLQETPDVPLQPVAITTPDAFDRALSTAVAGAVLTLAPTFRYPGPVTLRVPVTLQAAAVPPGRLAADVLLPTFLMGLGVPSDLVTLTGIEVRNSNTATDIVTIAGASVMVDRCRILGDPVKGGKRGINFTGTAGQILRCVVDDIFRLDQDTQAIYSDNMGGGLTISDCSLRAAGETIMFGGADCAQDRIPRGIRIRGCTLTKNPAWTVLLAPGKHAQFVKNALELKNAIDVIVEDCAFEYAGSSGQQGAFLIVLTPRNQGGTAPWSTVQDVIIRRCTGRFASGAISLLGDDNLHPSGRLTNVTFENLTFTDLDGPTYGGMGRICYLNRAPDLVTIDGLTASGTNLKSIVYFDETKPPTRLTLRNFKVPAGTRYPYHNLFGDTLASVQTYAPDAVLAITAGDTGAAA